MEIEEDLADSLFQDGNIILFNDELFLVKKLEEGATKWAIISLNDEKQKVDLYETRQELMNAF